MLAEIGALNAFGLDRRSALWQVERAIRPAGELFDSALADRGLPTVDDRLGGEAGSPLAAMTPSEQLVADYAGTGLTIGPHPMTFRRHELSMRGVLRAVDLPRERSGRSVRAAVLAIPGVRRLRDDRTGLREWQAMA